MNDRLKAVLVGCGGISDLWIQSLVAMADVELAGLVDINDAAARQKAEKHRLSGAMLESDLGRALSAIRPDVVFNCTIPSAHTQTTLAAVEAGCHVLLEKPLAETLADARTLAEASQRTGKLVAVMQNRRFNRHIRSLRNFLESGAIGRINTVDCRFYLPLYAKGFRREMPHVLLLDMAIHTFDAARFLTGANAEDVFAVEWNPAGSWFARDASAAAIFRMAGGAVFSYVGSWSAEGLSTPWESEWRVIGENGSVTWDGADGFRAQVAKPVWVKNGWRRDIQDAVVPVEAHPDKEDGHASVIRDFVACVRAGRCPETAASDNLHSLAMVLAAVESSERGARVPVPAG